LNRFFLMNVAARCADHQAVPRGEDLVVEMRPGTQAASREEGRAIVGEPVLLVLKLALKAVCRLGGRQALDEHVQALQFAVRIGMLGDVALGLHTVRGGEFLDAVLAEHLEDLAVGPDVERALGFAR
jgi:hypothetical protein